MISTGALTDLFLDALRSSGVIVGDGVAPGEVGWSSGTPNTGVFVAYSVLGFGGASPANPDVDHSDPEFTTNWSLRHYGGSREQADWVADRVRAAVHVVAKVPFGQQSDRHRVIGVRWVSLGQLSRNDTVDPPYWQAQDSVQLMTSRVRMQVP